MPKTAAKTARDPRKAQRALDATIGKGAPEPAAPEAPTTDEPRETLIYLRHAEIAPDPHNARKEFDEDDLSELRESLLEHGLLQNLVVRRVEDAHRLVAGERRWRAIGLAIEDGDWPLDRPIPCRLYTGDDAAATIAGLVENLKRVDLNPMELAEGLEALAQAGLANKAISEQIGRTPEYVQQYRRLTGLDDETKAQVRAGDVTFTQAREILARPKVEPLEPRVALMLAEIAWAQGNHWSAPCGIGAGEAVKGLGGVQFRASTWEHQCSISVYGTGAFDIGPFVRRSDEALAELNRLRLAAGFTWLVEGEEAPAERPGDAFVQHWLREPFDFGKANADAKAKAEAVQAEREKARAAEVEREKQARKAVAKRLRGYAILPVEKLTEQAAKLIKFPLYIDESGDVCDQEGEPIVTTNYGDDPDVAALCCLLLNRAAGMPGYGKPPEAEGEADDEDGDEIPAREPVTTGEVQDTAEEGEPGVAASAPFERPGLAGDGFSQQMREARMASEAEAFAGSEPELETEAAA